LLRTSTVSSNGWTTSGGHRMRRPVMPLGKRYRRIRYGKEPTPKGRNEIMPYPRHDCGVVRGELHLE
jgi:hypothetical protein